MTLTKESIQKQMFNLQKIIAEAERIRYTAIGKMEILADILKELEKEEHEAGLGEVLSGLPRFESEGGVPSNGTVLESEAQNHLV
jgi:hypothetical protein